MARRLLLASLLCLCACTTAQFAAVNIPASLQGGYGVHSETFDPAHGLGLDIYTPDAAADDAPVIVFFYGGRWENGTKEDYRFVGATLARAGFITVIPDYRKFPAVRFPAFIEDGAAAVAWVHGRIAGEGRKIHLLGHSAGAHIAALINADERYLAQDGLKTGDVIADFAGLAGPYDFTPDEPDLIAMFGPPERYPQMQVPSFIDGGEPPMLLLTGGQDTTVKPYNAARLAAAIRTKGGAVGTADYPGLDHAGLIKELSWLSAGTPLRRDIEAFFGKDAAGAAKP